MDHLFRELSDYRQYLEKYPFHEELGVDLENYGDPLKKQVKTAYYSVDPTLSTPFPPELDDLTRLHYLVTSRKVTTILEFGVGKSSKVFDHALAINKASHEVYVKEELRRSNPFECHSIDNYKEWIDKVNSEYKTNHVTFHHCECTVSTFNDRVCTYYNGIPNICPDFIYLDGPDQFSPIGNVRGINTNHPDRLPMSADILSFEHFLLPGTLIVVDGRTANARFLKANLQREWTHFHHVKYDQHYFELTESPLGIYNKKQIDYCLGENFYERVK